MPAEAVAADVRSPRLSVRCTKVLRAAAAIVRFIMQTPLGQPRGVGPSQSLIFSTAVNSPQHTPGSRAKRDWSTRKRRGPPRTAPGRRRWSRDELLEVADLPERGRSGIAPREGQINREHD